MGVSVVVLSPLSVATGCWGWGCSGVSTIVVIVAVGVDSLWSDSMGACAGAVVVVDVVAGVSVTGTVS